jgi:assimilatory nitrate reductase catalytic subunit
LPYDEAVATVAREIDRIQRAYGHEAIGILGGASLTTEKTYLLGKFARVCLKTPFIDYNGRLCMVSAGAANKKAFGIDRTTNPWSDMVGTEVIWVAGSNVAECSPITTNYLWQAREQGARIIIQDPRITPAPLAIALTNDGAVSAFRFTDSAGGEHQVDGPERVLHAV